MTSVFTPSTIYPLQYVCYASIEEKTVKYYTI